jgi:hypothetical protein
LAEVCPNLTKILKTDVTLPVTNCEAERNLSKLSIKKTNKFRLTMLEDRLDYTSVLSIENVTTKSLSFEEAIKEYAAKKCGGKEYYRVVSEVNENTMLIFWIL